MQIPSCRQSSSVKNVTWYYWGQNRFGNFIPFLTQWIPDIRLNFIAQIYLRCAFGFVAIFSALELVGREPERLLVERFAVSVVLIFSAARGGFLSAMWWGGQPYGTALALTYPALRVIAGKEADSSRVALRYTAGFAFFWLSFFVDLALAILLLPFFFLRLLRTRQRADLDRFVLAGLAAAAAFGHSQLFQPRTPLGFAVAADPLTRGLAACLGEVNLTLIAILAGVAVVLPWLAPPRRREHLAPSSLELSATTEMVLACLFFVAFVASLEWVVGNRMEARYFTVPVLMGIVMVASAITLSIFRDFPRMLHRRGETRLLLACLAGMAVWLTLGGLTEVRVSAIVNGHPITASRYLETIDLPWGHPVIVDGDYWRAWPLVYAIMAAQPNNRQVYALATRWQAEARQLHAMLATHRSIVLLCLQNAVADCDRDLRALVPTDIGIGSRIVSQGRDPGGGFFAVEDIRLAHPG